MPQCDIYDLSRNKVGSTDLDPKIFESPVKEHLFYYVVNWQLANRRAGTASTKTRGEVRGGGRKPWKQKHLGRARQGSIRAPQWRKGAVIFGPKPRDWSFSIPKKVRRGALISALSLKNKEGSILILKDFNIDQMKTKLVADFIRRFGIDMALIVVNGENENLVKSARNLKSVKVLRSEGLNVYDLLRFNTLVMTEDSLHKVQEVLKG